MITEDYVSFETAKLLKEKGFDEKVKSYFTDDGLTGYKFGNGQTSNSELDECFYSRPTLQMAMKWLREVHLIFIRIVQSHHFDYCGCEIYYNRGCCYEFRVCFDSYEEAAEAAIKYCLENLI